MQDRLLIPLCVSVLIWLPDDPLGLVGLRGGSRGCRRSVAENYHIFSDGTYIQDFKMMKKQDVLYSFDAHIEIML